MPLIRQESIDAVLEACDMLEIVSPYTTIRKSGSTYMGKCPFHQEKTPSFTVDPVRKLYHCFGCGEGGNVFTFLKQKEGLEFADAVKWLGEKYGVRIEYEQSDPAEEKRRAARGRALSLLDQAASFYSRYLWESRQAEAARRYLEERGFSRETAEEFRLGYSPPSGGLLVRKALDKGYQRADLEAAGLVSARGGRLEDRFRGRLMFPFTDHRGRVLGFGARVLGEGRPKYLNSPESAIYRKRHLLFGLGNARRAIAAEDRAYVVEGYTDVLALHQEGIENAVASMGTALTETQLKELSRFTRNIYLAFDADAAGRKAMLRALELSRRLELSPRLVEIPPGKDPAEIVLESGADAFRELAEKARALLEYQVHAVLDAADLGSSEGRVRAFAALKPILAFAVNSVERDEQTRIIADRLRLAPENVAYLLETAHAGGAEAGGGEAERRVLSQEEILERTFLVTCLARRGEAGRYLKEMTEAHFTTGPTRSAFKWVREQLCGDHGDAAAAPPRVEAGSILPELIIRAETAPTSSQALPELYLRLSEAELSRRIDALKHRLDQGGGDFQQLARLEEKRRRLLEHIQAGSFDIA